MFQPSIEFVPLDPEFPMLTTRPPCFSLWLSEMLIVFPYAISIFHWNSILIKFGNKVRRNKGETLNYVSCFSFASYTLKLLPACFTTEKNNYSRLLYLWEAIRQLNLYVSNRQWRPSGYVFFSYWLCVFRLFSWGGKWADHTWG